MGYEILTTYHGPMIFNSDDIYVGRAFRELGQYSGEEVSLLCSLLEPDSVVVEAGAHIGTMTVPMAKKCAVIFAFEPQRLVFQMLCANLALNQGMRAFWNTYSANIFNNAATYDANTGGDGQPLLSTTHPLDVGTYANTTSTALALNETSLFVAYEMIYNGLLQQSGLKVDADGETLVVPAHLEAQARRLQNAVLRPGTANNDPNELGNVGGAAKRIKVMRYLTNRFAWFVTTNQPGLWHLQRSPYEARMWHDDASQNLSVASYERVGFFCSDSRAVVGFMATA